MTLTAVSFSTGGLTGIARKTVAGCVVSASFMSKVRTQSALASMCDGGYGGPAAVWDNSLATCLPLPSLAPMCSGQPGHSCDQEYDRRGLGDAIEDRPAECVYGECCAGLSCLATQP